MAAAQKPLELILARNLLASLSTPAFLVDRGATLVFYNEAAGSLLGRRFEETGPISAETWSGEFGPFDKKGRAIPVDKLPVTVALREGRPAHDDFKIRDTDGTDHKIEVSALPIVASDESSGAIVVFWPIDEDD